MLRNRHISREELRAWMFLVALTAGAVPANAQRVPPSWSLPTDPAYVSLSGAVTVGFPVSLRDVPPDPIGLVPRESQIPGLCQGLFEEMWRGSATFRRQWTRLAGARIRVMIVLGKPLLMGTTRAHAELSRTPDLQVRIWLPLVDSAAVEYLAHEIEHVLEALDDVDLPAATAHKVHGVTALGEPPSFETNRAIAVGRLVAREVAASQAQR